MDVDLIMENEKLIYSIINKYNGYYDKEDLYQVGIIGLINAAKNFNDKMNTKFSTYAYTYIFGEINKYIRENNNLKISKEIIKLKKTIERTRDILRQKLSREPTTIELSLLLEIDEEKIREIDNVNQSTKSLDYEINEDNNLYNSIRVEDKETNPDIMDLKKEISNLEEDEKKLIYSRYYVDMTQTETSKELGISQVQVYRKETKILQKLKQRL